MTANRTKVTVKNDGFEGFIRRGREHAKALDDGKTLPSEIVINFETPAEMMWVFTHKRTELLEKLTQEGKQPIHRLADRLKRKRTAVSRDVGVLQKLGVVSTRSVTNPGHGKLLMVSPLAKRYEFTWSVGSAVRRVSKQRRTGRAL